MLCPNHGLEIESKSDATLNNFHAISQSTLRLSCIFIKSHIDRYVSK